MACVILPVLLLAIAGSRPVGAAPRLWQPRPVPAHLRAAPEAVRTIGLRPSFAFLDQDADSIMTLPLPDGDSLEVRRIGRERPQRNRLLWRGRVEGDPQSSVIFSRVRDVVVGTITSSRGRRWRVRYAGAGEHVLEEVRVSRIPLEGAGLLVPMSAGGGDADPTCTSDPEDQVDLLVLYTAAAVTGAGGVDAMEADIHMFVGATNQSFINSGIETRVRLVHQTATDYVEIADAYLEDELNDLARSTSSGTTTGPLDEVFKLRDDFGADIVLLVVEEASSEISGLSIPMRDVDVKHEEFAFAVVERVASEAIFSFAHEIGHIFAACHERSVDAEDYAGDPYDFNFGYVWMDNPDAPTTGWRTMMAYGRDCGFSEADSEDEAEVEICPRLLYWSNYEIPRGTVAMGVAPGEDQAADNRKTLNTTDQVVANFRCATPTREDAWMKDAWADSGLEPEPALDGEPMWKSPYIWVRHEPDPDRLHAHQHQNPRAGAVNYAYVKIHGGTEDLTGKLELYYAEASSGIRWREDWTLIEAIELGPLDAYDTRIVEFAWTPREAGHFCLLARWDCGDDPMATPEGERIATNVRANNNLVWRNVNVLAAGGDGSATASFLMRNVERFRETYSLTVKLTEPRGNKGVLRHGRLRLRVPPAIAREWQRQGARGSGFVVTNEWIVIKNPQGAVIENLRLEGRAEIPVIVELVGGSGKPSRIPPGEVDFIQTRTTNGRAEVIGGVSYQLGSAR